MIERILILGGLALAIVAGWVLVRVGGIVHALLCADPLQLLVRQQAEVARGGGDAHLIADFARDKLSVAFVHVGIMPD